MKMSSVLFVSHGAPTFALEPGKLGPQLSALGKSLPRPQAVLVISPHWLAPQVRVNHAQQLGTVHDFGGFARELYSLQYPAVGHPALAERTLEILAQAGWSGVADEQRGLDHGAWVPLRYLYPKADVPVFQLAMPYQLDTVSAYTLGQALAPLQQEGVLIIGSGGLTHNLYEFNGMAREDAPYVKEFARWVADTVTRQDHASLTNIMALAPHAQRAHPSLDHLLPLLIAAGAAGTQAKVTVLEGGITYGMLSMDSYLFTTA